jgi:membrane associated rhomboid family serine protease
MLQSLVQDLKHNYRHGNMVTRLIIINVAVFVVTALTKAFAPSFYNAVILEYLALPADLWKLLTRPWTVLTHMFIHSGGWHLIWNMLMLYWFGRIVGDLLKDNRIWPLYLLGSLAGAVAYIISFHLLSNVVGARAVGASAGIMAIVAAAGAIAPDYNMRLILLGDVRLKYIVAVLIFVDVLSAGGYSNAGGAVAHLGGAVLGFAFVAQLRNGYDMTTGVNRVTDWVANLGRVQETRSAQRNRKSPLTVKHRTQPKRSKAAPPSGGPDLQQQVDQILDKIKSSGYDSLTKSEREILLKASKDS